MNDRLSSLPWSCACHDPFGQHSRHQHLGESGAEYWASIIRRGLGAGVTLVVLGGTIDRWCAGRPDLSLVERGAGRCGRGKEKSIIGTMFEAILIVAGHNRHAIAYPGAGL